MDRAGEFYEEKLGLSGVEDQQDGSRVYACGGDTSLHVYPSPANAGRAPATVATWKVDVLVRVVDELTSGGVTFERYDEPGIETDGKRIFEFDEGGVAWFRDPDGNSFAIEQE
jgi:catechol 2,3-dioxygenase-like lactoylglutathione lyase family enzyme